MQNDAIERAVVLAPDEGSVLVARIVETTRVGPDVASKPTLGVRTPRVLVWDANNSSSVFTARAFARNGWQVDWLGSPTSGWSKSSAWNTRRTISGYTDPDLHRIFAEHPLDAVALHGDDQVRWVLLHWSELPNALHRSLPPPESLEIGLSKRRSMEFVSKLGIPVLETVACMSRDDVAAAAERLGARDRIVLKGEGGAAGSSVVGLRAGSRPKPHEWHSVTAHGPSALAQKRLRGPRMLVTVAYERGVERASCVHEKLLAYPLAFGPCAFGITRRSETLHAYAEQIFTALQWHGIADIEFRQDEDDGQWYFMEINPRVCATLGIQESAGMDLVGAWARACAGRGDEAPPGRNYRDGVRYAWGSRAVALALRHPWKFPRWGMQCLLSKDCDLQGIDPELRGLVLRTAMWMARHE